MKTHSPTIQQNSPNLFASLCNGITISLIEAPWWIAMLALIFPAPCLTGLVTLPFT